MKKNIMLLIGYLTNGGAERSITNVANELSKYHNVVLVVASAKKQDYSCNTKIIEIEEFKYKKTKIKGLLKLRKLKKQYNINATISYTTVFNFYNVMSKYKDETIISIRNHLSTKKEGLLATLLHKISIKLCNKIICCSKSVANDQIRNFKANKEKICIINNFFNQEVITNGMNEIIDISEEKICNNLIVTMARLVPHKGHKHIIKAMSLVVKEIPDAKLLIFSRGPLKEELEALSEKYNLEKNIKFMGFHPNPYKFIKIAKAFILASDYEGFPNVLIEAMACGTPIIATSSPGGTCEILTDKKNLECNVTELMETEYGILIPSFVNDNDENSIIAKEIILKEAIIKLLKNKDIYDKYHEASLLRSNYYKCDRIIKEWLKVVQ